MTKKLRDYFKDKKTRDNMSFQELADHYNFCVAKGIEELGKIGPNEHDYLFNVKMELTMRIDNPSNIFGAISDQVNRTKNRN